MMTTFFLFVTLFATAWILASLAAVRVIRTQRLEGGARPPVTVLKPLCGADPGLEDNLVSFFRQDYPAFQLVFGVQSDDDAAVPVLKRVMRRYPDIDATLVVHPAEVGLNPKVANLLGMLPFAKYDAAIISDSNVRVSGDYLDSMIRTLEQPNVGLVSSPILAVGEKNLGAALDATRINGWVTPGAALPTALGSSAVIGKSLAFRRSELTRIGGLESCADLLAEDYVLGKMYQYAGMEVRLAPTPVVQIMNRAPVASFWKRHMRWSMMRLRMAPAAFALEPMTNPAFVALVGLVAGIGPTAVVIGVVMSTLRDLAANQILGRRTPIGSAGFGPLADLLALGIWAVTPFRRHVTWRGNRVRLSAGTRLYHTDEAAPTVA